LWPGVVAFGLATLADCAIVRDADLLFIAPSEVSSGESITALHAAEWLRRDGRRVHFLASASCARFIRNSFPDAVTALGTDRSENRRTWDRVLRDLKPGVIVFADYPLLTLGSGTIPLHDESWAARLDECDAELFTLDHLGYAQRPRLIFFGPAHRTIGLERLGPIPARMRVLLPCPLHDPAATQLRGQPFQYWRAPAAPSLLERDGEDLRRSLVRSSDELLVVHCTSGWACNAASLIECPYYEFLPALLCNYLGDLDRPVAVVSVNTGALLQERTDGRVRIVNAGPLTPSRFERLLRASDLVLTENRVSVSLARAILLRKPCVVLRNSRSIGQIIDSAPAPLRQIAQAMEAKCLGSVFPFDVFPIWAQGDLDELNIFDAGAASGSYTAVEVFGGSETSEPFRLMLTDGTTRDRIASAQTAYLDRLRTLPSPVEALNVRTPSRGALPV
jgi:Family of unknown function (DUF6365)